MENNHSDKLYPALPTEDMSPNPMMFRLQQINEVKTFLEKEMEYRRGITRKYKKAFNIMTYVSHTLSAVGAASGAISLTSLANLMTAPVGLALGGVAIASTSITAILTWQKKKIMHKMEKHEKIHTLAVSKLNTINELVNKALTDSHISQEEFLLIVREKGKYTEMKNAIRKKNMNTPSGVNVEELKKTFLEEGKKLAQTEMFNKLTKQE